MFLSLPTRQHLLQEQRISQKPACGIMATIPLYSEKAGLAAPFLMSSDKSALTRDSTANGDPVSHLQGTTPFAETPMSVPEISILLMYLIPQPSGRVTRKIHSTDWDGIIATAAARPHPSMTSRATARPARRSAKLTPLRAWWSAISRKQINSRASLFRKRTQMLMTTPRHPRESLSIIMA